MFKFAAKILDVLDEESLSSIPIKLGEALPEFARDAKILTPEERDLILDPDFAVVYYNLENRKSRKYLLIDPGNVWLSAKYFLDARDAWPRIAQGIIVRSILSRAEKYGISGNPIFAKLAEIKTSLESDGTWKKLPEMNVYNEGVYHREKKNEEILRSQQERSGQVVVKSAAVNGNRVFALRTGDDFWVDRPMYDISTPELVKQAEQYFSDHQHNFPLKTKCRFARALLKQARALNVPVNDRIKLYGSEEIDTKTAHINMMRRAQLCCEDHRKLAADILFNMPKMNADELICCIEHFDKKAFGSKIQRFGISDPAQSVLKKDESSDNDKMVYNQGIEKLSLRQLKDVVEKKEIKLSEVFDTNVVKSLKSSPEKAFKALPQPYKKIIVGLAK